MPRSVPITLMPGTRGRIRAPELRRIALHVLHAEGVARDVPVELALVDTPTIQELNRLYRGRDEPTDVLSFAASEGEAFLDAPDTPASLGEVVICVPYVDAQVQSAEVRGEQISPGPQIAHLLVHGLLHLLGHDHELGELEAASMTTREEHLLAALGYEGLYVHGH